MHDTKSLDLNTVMGTLDEWVSLQSNGKYVPAHSNNPAHKLSIINSESLSLGLLNEIYGIQQVREEIKKFVEVIILHNQTNSILEIGLGHCGSTHFLWRLLFDKVVTIEKSYERIREFSKHMSSYYKKWVFDDEKSLFLIGYSNEHNVVVNSRKLLPDGIDVLFIDGDHNYGAVLTDWLLYAPLVKKGGIVAFHDSEFTNTSGAPRLINELSDGTVDGKHRKIHKILESDICGIGYYINE
jgi:predicted O-methyltransferase YrrM